MDISLRLQVLVFAFLILMVIYIHLITATKSFTLLHRILAYFILPTMVLIILDASFLLLNGRPGQVVRSVVTVCKISLIAGTIIPLLVYSLYLEFRINNNTKRLKATATVFGVLSILNLFTAVLSVTNGYYFNFDGANVFHRGPLTWVYALFYGLVLAYDVALVVWYRKELKGAEKAELVLPLVPVIVCYILRIAYFGNTVSWIGATLSILIVYLSIQNQTLTTDYLTGLYNRRHLDNYLRQKLDNLSTGCVLAGIMLDIDGFKQINDSHGHLVGDQALETTGYILRRYFCNGEFIARYAGDEFVVLFETDENESLDDTCSELRKYFDAYNQSGKAPYKLHISMGCAQYRYGNRRAPESFLKHLDKLLYKDKEERQSRV